MCVPQVTRLNLDVHAKRGDVAGGVFTRRYLIHELHQAVTGGNSTVFCPAEEQGKWKLRPSVSFLFFTSHTPCKSKNALGVLYWQAVSLNVCNMTTINWEQLSHVKTFSCKSKWLVSELAEMEMKTQDNIRK